MSDFPLFIALVLVYYAAACYFLDLGGSETSRSLPTPTQVGTSNLAQPKLQALEPLPVKRKAGRPRKLINHPANA